MALNTVLLSSARSVLQKRAFVPPQAAAGQAPPGQGQPGMAQPGMDPAAAAGGAMPADPAMAGGQPPMDPAMMGGQAPAAPPADPAAAGGAGGGQDVMSALSMMLDEKLKALNPAAGGVDGAGAKPKAAKPQPATVADIKRMEKLLAGLYEASGTPLPYSIMQDDANEEGAAPAGGSSQPAAAPK